MSKVTIFSVYFSHDNLDYKNCIETEVIKPIQTGKVVTHFNLGMLSDDTGENISAKNPYYGETTCWYWVWKNWIKEHPETEYIGFTQYRRLPTLVPYRKNDDEGHYLKQVSKRTFSEITRTFTEEKVYNAIKDYDLIVVNKWKTLVTTRWQFTSFLPSDEWISAREAFVGKDKDERNLFDTVMNQREGRYKCNFIMKKELFEDFSSWLFTRLFDFENSSDWKDVYPPKKGNERIAAFITECFMNLWIEKQFNNKNLSIKEVNLYEETMYKKQMKDNIARLKWFFTFPKHLYNVSKCK